MEKWIRFHHRGSTQFGTLEGGEIAVHNGSLFEAPMPSGEVVAIDDVEILTPVAPSKMIALANNSRSLLAKQGAAVPEEPLYLLKANSSFWPHGKTIHRPHGYEDKVIYEGELGLVIGKLCREVPVNRALDYLFGCTCVNDVTAIEILHRDPSFPQWTRAKAPDTFGVFGPVVATGLDSNALTIRALLDGDERQNYSVDDLVFKPADLISRISHDMTLLPGDVIACGTSVGAGSMKSGSIIEVEIDGVGVLSNRFH